MGKKKVTGDSEDIPSRAMTTKARSPWLRRQVPLFVVVTAKEEEWAVFCGKKNKVERGCG